MEREKRSWKIAERAFKHPQFQKAENIYFFVSTPLEVDTEFLIDRALTIGKHVGVPKSDMANKALHWYEIKNRVKDLKEGVLGIYEPNSSMVRLFSGEPGCVFVPGLVFDKKNNRIGRGAGFYDRFLATLPPNIYKAGLAFSFQVLPEIPVNEYDVRLDEVITD